MAILALGPLALMLALVQHTVAAHMDFEFCIGLPFFGAARGVPGPLSGLPAYARPVSVPLAEES
ncbi:MAG TPA: hypothetical protein VF515_16020 [Candidatus Binatia bacterium]|jgi:hypothetical protein